MLPQQLRAFLVIKHAAEPVAVTRRREVRRDSRFADRVHVHAQVEQLGQQRVPSAISRPKQGVLAERRLAFGVETEVQEMFYGFRRILFSKERLSDAMVQ